MAIIVGSRVKCGTELGEVLQLTPQEDPPDTLCIIRFDVRPNAPEWKSITALVESNAAPQEPEPTIEEKLAAAELELSETRQALVSCEADLAAAQTALTAAQTAAADLATQLQAAQARIAQLEAQQPPP